MLLRMSQCFQCKKIKKIKGKKIKNKFFLINELSVFVVVYFLAFLFFVIVFVLFLKC